MSATLPSPAEVRAAHEAEHVRREQASGPAAQYGKGLLTFDEFVASLQRIRLDERQWATPGPTFPVVTAGQYARLLQTENEEAVQDV